MPATASKDTGKISKTERTGADPALAWSKKSTDDKVRVPWVLPSLSFKDVPPQIMLSSWRDISDVQNSFCLHPTSQAALTPERSTVVLYLKVSSQL